MPDEVHEIRQDIDRVDESIVELLAKRMQLSHEIGELKKEVGIPIVDKGRWEKIVEKCVEVGVAKGLPREYVVAIFDVIHRFSIEEQKKNA